MSESDRVYRQLRAARIIDRAVFWIAVFLFCAGVFVVTQWLIFGKF